MNDEITHNAINCGTQYPTNVPHDCAETWGTIMPALKSCALVGTPYT
jgi:hypothetical protein